MRWAQLQILTWELRHNFIFNFFFPPSLLWCSLSSLELIQMAAWDLEGKKKKDFVGVFFFWYFTNRRTCNAGEGFDTESLFLFLPSQQKQPQTTLPGRWRGGMMTSPSRMPELGTWRGNSKELKAWVAQRRKWGNSAATSAPTTQGKEFVHLWGVCKVPKDCQECRETSASWSVPVPRGQTQPSLCCSQQEKLPKLSCVAAGQWQQLIYLVASAVAEALMQSVVPILWHLFDLKRSQCCYKWIFS